jgi:hypothetical protein
MPSLEFATPSGLLLLLLIPLVLLFRRRKARPRRVALTTFFLLEALRRRAPRTTLRLLRLTRAQRLALVVAVLACLSLALAETALVLRRPPPERWLVVVDNTPPAAGQVGGASVAGVVRDYLQAIPAALTPGDAVTVVTTSPAPAVSVFTDAPALRAHLAAVAPAGRSAPLEAALALADDLAPRHQRALLLSPRAGAWRRSIAGRRSERTLSIPGDRGVGRGNRGIVFARARASTTVAGRYDLFAVVRSTLEPEGELAVALSPGGAPAVVALRGGEGRLLLESVALAAGDLEIRLPGRDAFAGDDSLTFTLPAASTIAVAVPGERAAFLEAAVATHTGFRVAPETEAQVDVRLGEAPPRLARPTLLVFPVRDQAGLLVKDLRATAGAPRWHPDHAVTRALRDGSFRPANVLSIEADAGYASLAEVDAAPFLYAGERDGHRVLVWAFDPREGGLFARPEFVMLLRESIDWLGGRSEIPPVPAPDALSTADAVEVTLPQPDPDFFQRPASGERRVDAVPWLLAAVLFFGAFLAVSDAFAGGDEEGA